MLAKVVLGSLLLSAILGAVLFWAYSAGVMAERKRKATYTLGEAVRAYTLSVVALLGAFYVTAVLLEKVF